MWILHDDDGQEIGVMRRVRENGELVEKLVPVAEEAARMSEAMQASRPKPEAKPAEKEPEKPSVSPLEATLILARRGNREILPKLREVLDKSPELWRHFGDLTRRAQENWLRLLSGTDLYLIESVRRHLDEMRNQLAGANASALERLLVDRLLACHIAVLYFEAVEAQHLGHDNAKLDQFRMQRQHQANRQFLAAAKTLATVRQLMSRTVILGVVHQQPAPATPVESIIAGAANGDQPARSKRKAKASKKAGVNGSARGVNGHNRVNGNRVAHLLGAAASGESG